MKFSVVGLPHYTVWHMYEPSVDDLRHMEEMENERKNREKEEKERQERMKKINNEFSEPTSQWEKDKTEIQVLAKAKSSEKVAGDEKGPLAPPPAQEPAESPTAKNPGPESTTKAAPEEKATL